MSKSTTMTKTTPPPKCPRCDGAMVTERCQDMLTVFYAWRCLNCGEIVDDVVNRNRGVAERPPKKRLAS